MLRKARPTAHLPPVQPATRLSRDDQDAHAGALLGKSPPATLDGQVRARSVRSPPLPSNLGPL